MSEPVRLELTGKNAEQWNRVFDTLTTAIARAAEMLAPSQNEFAKQFASDVADITKGWVKAKIERPSLENEKLVADIVKQFEEAKLTVAQREKIEIENDLKRIELWEKRLSVALKWLGFIQAHVVKHSDGSIHLILTSMEMRDLLSEVRGVSHESKDANKL